MASQYEAGFVGMFDSVDELIRQAENPHHRAILLNYRVHGLLEVSQRYRELMAPDMMVEHPVYRMNEDGKSFALDGRDQVASFYHELEASGAIVLWPVEQVVAVADWGFASEALFRQFVPGSVLAAGGADIDDLEATYLVSHVYSMVWPYDERARLIGEHVYEDGSTRQISKPDPADVITPADAKRLLAPVLATPPALTATTA